MSTETHGQVLSLIEHRLRTNWADDEVDVVFEQDRQKRSTGLFIRASVRSLRSIEVGYNGGSILYRRPGWISMQCFVEVGNGTRRARDIADDAIAIFEGQQFSGVTCRESEMQELGDDGKGYWQCNAKVFFDFDYERNVS